ncbi:uncharacterized protein BJ171DRAFT_254234 [Polychytrium aggregatum]|uniref:uncharacterized protein n=1 Tax=Polychytrium aggregatum TaxID=110093 RepID=UPI0022FE7275|nr:uncharacterized protein BJ171DRAFT_254234 [Polychytrium aggregatum]KAI9193527.1 hypothetical protein BJ171DRAFT_254234 [Polychytrium aggregatum]
MSTPSASSAVPLRSLRCAEVLEDGTRCPGRAVQTGLKCNVHCTKPGYNHRCPYATGMSGYTLQCSKSCMEGFDGCFHHRRFPEADYVGRCTHMTKKSDLKIRCSCKSLHGRNVCEWHDRYPTRSYLEVMQVDRKPVYYDSDSDNEPGPSTPRRTHMKRTTRAPEAFWDAEDHDEPAFVSPEQKAADAKKAEELARIVSALMSVSDRGEAIDTDAVSKIIAGVMSERSPRERHSFTPAPKASKGTKVKTERG